MLPSAAVAICAPRAGAQETRDAGTVTVTGNVVDQTTGEPIPGVVIPAQYSGLGTSCGVVFIRLRRGG